MSHYLITRTPRSNVRLEVTQLTHLTLPHHKDAERQCQTQGNTANTSHNTRTLRGNVRLKVTQLTHVTLPHHKDAEKQCQARGNTANTSHITSSQGRREAMSGSR